MPARVAAQIDLFADLDVFDVEPRAGLFEDVQRGVHDFRADAVAVSDRDGGLVRHLSLLSAEIRRAGRRFSPSRAASGAKPYHRPMGLADAAIAALAERLRAASRVTVITGAGVSAASGIPTFRGSGGIWKSFSAARLATPEAFDEDPRLVWEWYAWRRSVVAQASPNRAHQVLAAWSRRYPEFALVTQNVDGLHERAGTRNVIRFHGSLWELSCAAPLRRLAAALVRCIGADGPAADVPALRRHRTPRGRLVRGGDSRPGARRRVRGARLRRVRRDRHLGGRVSRGGARRGGGPPGRVHGGDQSGGDPGVRRGGRRDPREGGEVLDRVEGLLAAEPPLARVTGSNGLRSPPERRYAWRSVKKALWVVLAVGIALAGAWGYGELVRQENDQGQPVRLLAIAEEQSMALSFSRRGRLTTRVPEEGEAIATGAEVARIEEPGLAEDASDIERQISQVQARDRTRLAGDREAARAVRLRRRRRAPAGCARPRGRVARRQPGDAAAPA